jgi:flagellar hook-associated protein 2
MATSGVSFSGLASGIDTDSLISSLVYAERAPIRAMESKQKQYNSELTSVQTLNSKLQAMQTKLEDMTELGDFLAYTATSSDEDYFTATATGDATPGTYDIQVLKLAQTERTYSDKFSSKTEAGLAGAGTLTIQVGSDDAIDIEIASEDDLADIVAKINASEAEVTASLMTTGTGYRIQVSAKESGSEHAIAFTESGSLVLNLDEAANEYKAAQDAQVVVDGTTITNGSNDIEDIITGVTLHLKKEQTESEQLAVAADETTVKTNVQSFIDAYNDVMKFLKSSDSADSTARNLQMQMSMKISSALDGMSSAYKALSQIGVKTSGDGTLTLDAAKLTDALEADPNGVASLFVGDPSEEVDGISAIFDDLIESYISSVDGILVSKKQGLNDAISALDNSINQGEERLSKYEAGLRAKFTQMELALQTLNSQSNSLSATN